MSSQPSGIRPLVTALRAWRRRIAGLVIAWAVVALFAGLIGLRPDVPRLGVVLVAVAALAWYAVDHVSSQQQTVWPLTDGRLTAGNRGNDYRVTNLAARLEAANARPEGRAELVHDLHNRLSEIIRERLYAKHGIVIEEEPRWAEGVMPPELWEFLVTLPPPDLYRPERLDQTLRRIEQW
ncbi:hypothetical protein [Intrasporangium sp.]|uniref:hypothetical protein n=1 Tax=Intrasporangium sp. TaxID=1925024 RepID=UPI00293B0C3C|nr:hypothetical protein [Intrasporangium sp.]MDV3221731.1 hypothetical protein [Intrasporangium sp.]